MRGEGPVRFKSQKRRYFRSDVQPVLGGNQGLQVT
jgi:hypothetical protein